jgi:hypothetical protein
MTTLTGTIRLNPEVTMRGLENMLSEHRITREPANRVNVS